MYQALKGALETFWVIGNAPVGAEGGAGAAARDAAGKQARRRSPARLMQPPARTPDVLRVRTPTGPGPGQSAAARKSAEGPAHPTLRVTFGSARLVA